MIIYTIDARTLSPHFPGIGRYLRSLIASLTEALSPEETLAVLYEESQSLPEKLDPSRKFIPAISPASPFSLTQQWQIPTQLKKSGARLYHSPYYLMPYLPGIPTVLTVYDLIPLKYPGTVSRRARLLFRTANRLALRSADHILAISENTRQDYLRAFRLSPARITTIPLAADACFHPQPPVEIERVRSKYAIQSYILYVGINKPHKNLVRLVEAWKHMVERGQVGDCRLVIAGAWDPRYPEAMQRAEGLGVQDRVFFTGPIPAGDLPGLYAGARFFVYPSLYEGFGLPVLEAMASGAPVLCANSPGLDEAAGEAALRMNPLQPGEMAEAMEKLLKDSNLRQNLREKGLAQAASFSWQRTAQETLNIYRRIQQ